MMSNKKQGFALLYALLVSSIVLSIGIVLSTIVTKQLILSSVATNSQLAFYAATSGIECAKFSDKVKQFGYTFDGDYYADNEFPPGSIEWDDNIECVDSVITFNSDDITNTPPYLSPIMKFDIFLAGDSKSCAKVELAFTPNWSVRSYGYSFSDGETCGDDTSFRLVERVVDEWD